MVYVKKREAIQPTLSAGPSLSMVDDDPIPSLPTDQAVQY